VRVLPASLLARLRRAQNGQAFTAPLRGTKASELMI